MAKRRQRADLLFLVLILAACALLPRFLAWWNRPDRYYSVGVNFVQYPHFAAPSERNRPSLWSAGY